MNLKTSISAILVSGLLFSCEKDGLSRTYESSSPSSSSTSSGNGLQSPQAGVITAGEWNDLDHWDFWEDLMQNAEYSSMPGIWGINTNQRIPVIVENSSGTPVVGVDVHLISGTSVLWSAKTDNFGKAELWCDFLLQTSGLTNSDLKIAVDNGSFISDSVTNGLNSLVVNQTSNVVPKAMISFVVDATGSMGDEMSFLKVELEDVLNRAQSENPTIEIFTSAVFYRDEGDEYVVIKNDFSSDVHVTKSFVHKQSAAGGGDFPEAVHKGLKEALSLSWQEKAAEKIIFLLLDAPPHNENQVLQSYHESLKKAAKMGVKIIPISASGIDKETEFLMRMSAMATNGTYVFITDDSGIGNSHLKPSVGDYQVEFLNELIIRLIDKYI